MTGSIAIDVVIGLVFIYLLYRLLATVVAEIISTNLGLRSKNLREAIDRMINDEKETTWGKDFFLFFNVFTKVKNKTINKFYDHQEIKYLGQSAIRNPAAIKAQSFSKVLLDLLKKEGTGQTDIEKILSGLDKITDPEHQASADASVLGPQTAEYVKSLLSDAQNDLEKFKGKLESWFDMTMVHTTEWYKRRVQVILFVIGFGIAWFMNADTFVIVKKLSTDTDARAKIVSLAAAYIENDRYREQSLLLVDISTLRKDSGAWEEYKSLNADYSKKMDTLNAIRQELKKDITEANTILGLGSILPDSIRTDKKGNLILPAYVDAKLAQRVIHTCEAEMMIAPSGWQQIHYSLGLMVRHFFGYFVTALAISLGAPFWFDLLNKLMKLRANVKERARGSFESLINIIPEEKNEMKNTIQNFKNELENNI
jgi:hypothetical protein